MSDPNTKLTQAFDDYFKASDAMKKVFDDSAMNPEQAAQHARDLLEVQRAQRQRILEENKRLDDELDRELEAHGHQIQVVDIPVKTTTGPRLTMSSTNKSAATVGDGVLYVHVDRLNKEDCLTILDDLSDPLPDN